MEVSDGISPYSKDANSVDLASGKQNGTIQVRLYDGEYEESKTAIRNGTKTIHVDIPAYQ